MARNVIKPEEIISKMAHNSGDVCSVCSKPVQTQGLCVNHYQRVWQWLKANDKKLVRHISYEVVDR